eukprot:TRINITY_DN2117_c0_g1_i2.p1 TRINITY_DN2117_c0_g1~~TRINITY_DN2117_c0_g1_i2.p1  ORF type:complete len:282 (-),score=15.10 TRINITY_DN2117_c0_g1_i2:64-909(-)
MAYMMLILDQRRILRWLTLAFVVTSISANHLAHNDHWQAGPTCPQNCLNSLGRGTCLKGTCLCNSPYTGNYCQGTAFLMLHIKPFNPSSNAVNVSPGTWAYYTVAVNNYPEQVLTINNLNITMTSWGFSLNGKPDPGCVFVVSQNAAFWTTITQEDIDSQPGVVFQGNATMSIAAAVADLESIVISITRLGLANDTSKCQFYLSAEADCASCVHGKCIEGTARCQCRDGWAGPSCELRLQALSIPWMIVVSICSFILGLGIMASFCRIRLQTQNKRAYHVF